MKWHIDIEGQVHVQSLDVRLFFPVEMDALLRHLGWSVVDKLGSFDGSPFATGSSNQIYICQKSQGSS